MCATSVRASVCRWVRRAPRSVWLYAYATGRRRVVMRWTPGACILTLGGAGAARVLSYVSFAVFSQRAEIKVNPFPTRLYYSITGGGVPPASAPEAPRHRS